jgi:thioredoxin-related protein
MDRRIIHWGLSGLLLSSVAAGVTVGATAVSKPAASSNKAVQSSQSTPLPQSAPSIKWIYDLKTAQAQSLASGKPMLIVCGGPWCVYCKKLEKEVLGHPTIARYINKTFIAVHLDSDKDQRAVQILEVKSLPTTVILSPNADLLGSVEGFVKPRDYASVLKQSVDFQKTLREDAALAQSKGKK